MNQSFTDEQINEITERVQKGLALLKELDLMPAAQVSIANTGNNCFQNKVEPYLQDTKYNKAQEVVETPTETEVIPLVPSENAEVNPTI